MSGVDVHLDGVLVASVEDGDLVWRSGSHRYGLGQPVLSVRLPRWTVAPPDARALVRAHLGALLPEVEPLPATGSPTGRDGPSTPSRRYRSSPAVTSPAPR